VQQWNGAVKMSSGRTGPGTRQNEEPRNDKKQRKTIERSGMQQWHKGPRTETAATRQNKNKGAVLQRAAIFKKRGDDQRDRQEGHRAGDGEASSSRNSQRVTKNDGLELVEGSTPSEAEKETADTGGTGNVGEPATP
jgi:hypothetical protein